MITEIKLKNFKCFQEEQSFPLGKLNLLTGVNGRGKSSFLQSLLLMYQSLSRNGSLNHLLLQGEYVDLGSFSDIKNSSTPQSVPVTFSFSYNKQGVITTSFLNFENDPEHPRSLMRKTTEVLDEQTLCSILQRIHYVGADRRGPVKFVEKVELPLFRHTGCNGEYTYELLAQSKLLDLHVNEKLYLGEDSNSLLQQTQEWMSYILDGARLSIKGNEEDSSVLYLLLNNRDESTQYKPTNTGFGYSYVLPLIVTGLLANPGEIVVIENPEAHLHPKAQSRLTEFFSKVASTGVQVFIESHSEHILNGIRIATLKSEIDINHNDVSIFFFSSDFRIVPIILKDDGKISNWEKGFFDQDEEDILLLHKLSHSNSR